MATRCFISMKVYDGYKAIVCEFDGYLSYTGKILLDYYNYYDKVRRLVELGTIMFIVPQIGDIELKNKKTFHFKDYKELWNCASKMSVDYIYLFESNKWWYIDVLYSSSEIKNKFALREGVNNVGECKA